MEKKKVGFASGIGFILAAAGSAVGLGNLWGFPYKTSQNGGAAFVLIYIACVLLIGFVTMLSEIYLGRRAQANPMTAYKMIHKNLGWCGLVAIVIPAFIICYYSVLGGWTTKYALNSFSGNAGIVGTFSVNTGEVILYTAIFLVLSMMIIMGGVKNGIEKASKVLMPVCALFSCIVVGWFITPRRAVAEIEAGGTPMAGWLKKVYAVMIRFVTPALILIVEIGGLQSEIAAGNVAVIVFAYALVALCVVAYFLFFRNTDTGTNADEKLSGDYPV